MQWHWELGLNQNSGWKSASVKNMNTSFEIQTGKKNNNKRFQSAIAYGVDK